MNEENTALLVAFDAIVDQLQAEIETLRKLLDDRKLDAQIAMRRLIRDNEWYA